MNLYQRLDAANIASILLVSVLNADTVAFKSNAVCCAVDTGLLASEVLSTFPKPTCAFVTECGLEVEVE